MKRTTWGAVLAALLCVGPAQAVPMAVPPALYVGDCTVAEGCLVATPTWSTQNATVGYAVTAPAVSGGAWHYSYTFAAGDGGALAKEISHLLLEVSPNITDASVATLFSNFSPAPHADLVEDWGDEGGSSPGIPSTLYGLKWEVGAGTFTWSFDSLRSPVWGDFYSKDGRNDGVDVYAYTSGWGTDPATGALGALGWVPTPDTVGEVDPRIVDVPAPAALVLLGLGLLASTLLRLRRA